MLLGAALAGSLSGCASDPAPFGSADEAVGSLVTALRADNEAELKRILGSESKDLLSSGDDVADENGRHEFLRLYDEKHALLPDGDDYATLEVGATDWPLPIPVVKGEKGWYFDTAAGLDEMLSRRIGRNELYAIQVCLAVADAEREYAAGDVGGDGLRAYASKFRSDPGKHDGLFWKAGEGEAQSPLGELVATASSEGYTARTDGSPQPFHGYLYRILSAQGPAAPGGAMDYMAKGRMIGGFAVVAWPADYANSGLKTFLVSHHGVVYEKDLGDDTDRIARGMKAFDPGEGWVASDVSESP
jgi:hypothetical protein